MARPRAVAQRIVQLFVRHADVSSERQCKLDISDLRLGVAVGAERDANTSVERAPNEPFVRPVAIRDLERGATDSERADRALLALLGPELHGGNWTGRQRPECGMG